MEAVKKKEEEEAIPQVDGAVEEAEEVISSVFATAVDGLWKAGLRAIIKALTKCLRPQQEPVISAAPPPEGERESC